MNPFPLSLGRIDHYTLIVPDAEVCTRFHIDILGFGWVREQKVNAGSAPEGGYDMLNHVLHLPGDPSRVVVVTEGLTENSIFRKYLEAHGPGIHHVAYAVDNLAVAFQKLEDAGISMTSNRIVHDPLSGLRQVFISREQTGYFIELIERTETAEEGTFKEGSMAELANSMKSYLGDDEGAGDIPTSVVGELPGTVEAVRSFLSRPENLPHWTAHQTVMQVGEGRWIERRLAGDVPLSVSSEADRVTFTWDFSERQFVVVFYLMAVENGVRVTVPMPEGVEGKRAVRTASIITSELLLLTSAMGEAVEPEALVRARHEIGRFHLEVYARPGA
jgi:catechol 2,3-dioxygenase-like lactoylglutathione lyase family enzyme